jgi:hypothetical protein
MNDYSTPFPSLVDVFVSAPVFFWFFFFCLFFIFFIFLLFFGSIFVWLSLR